jgi:hypothetical protein
MKVARAQAIGASGFAHQVGARSHAQGLQIKQLHTARIDPVGTRRRVVEQEGRRRIQAYQRAASGIDHQSFATADIQRAAARLRGEVLMSEPTDRALCLDDLDDLRIRAIRPLVPSACLIDEDYVGIIKHIVRRCTAGTQLHDVAEKVMLKYRWGMHMLYRYGL